MLPHSCFCDNNFQLTNHIYYFSQLNRIGPKLLFNGGILTTGTCAIFFGLLDKVNGHYPFIILSFLIRIVEALGNAAFLTASFAIIAKEFPNNVATTFASLETFFGLGLMVGPTVGGALYQVMYSQNNIPREFFHFKYKSIF